MQGTGRKEKGWEGKQPCLDRLHGKAPGEPGMGGRPSRYLEGTGKDQLSTARRRAGMQRLLPKLKAAHTHPARCCWVPSAVGATGG